MELVTQLKRQGKVINIYRDDITESPRTAYDNLSFMVCFHKKYELGDKHSFETIQQLRKHLDDTNAVYLPLFLLDHSGLMLACHPFGNKWDSGFIGFIFVDRSVLKEEGISDDKAKETLINDIETYNNWLCGDTFGYTINEEKICEHCNHRESQEIGSCWGFYGYENIISEIDATFPKEIENEHNS